MFEQGFENVENRREVLSPVQTTGQTEEEDAELEETDFEVWLGVRTVRRANEPQVGTNCI
jgi:hypothetical protein